MASISRRLLLHTRQCPCRVPAQRITPSYTASWQRPLSSTTRLRASKDEQDSSTPAATESPVPTSNQAQSEARSSPSPTALELRKLVEDLKALDPKVIADAVRQGKSGLPIGTDMEFNSVEDFEPAPDRGRPGFWAEGEESMGPDEDYYGDDLTSLGHGELEQHREMREYARLIAWELPLLNRVYIESTPEVKR